MKIIGKDGQMILVQTDRDWGFVADMDQRVRYPEKFLLSLTNFGSVNFQQHSGTDEDITEIMGFEVME